MILDSDFDSFVLTFG